MLEYIICMDSVILFEENNSHSRAALPVLLICDLHLDDNTFAKYITNTTIILNTYFMRSSEPRWSEGPSGYRLGMSVSG